MGECREEGTTQLPENILESDGIESKMKAEVSARAPSSLQEESKA